MSTSIITLEELKKHRGDKGDHCLRVAIHGLVYDLTKFRNKHPGGGLVFTDCEGRDCTSDFIKAKHYERHLEKLEQYIIGKLPSTEEDALVADLEALEVRPSKFDCCGHCGKSDPQPEKLCSRCKVIKYCDRSCQASAWKKHKKDCKLPGELFS